MLAIVKHLRFFVLLLVTGVLLCQTTQTNPWTPADLVDAESTAKALRNGATPHIICVAFPVLYRDNHISKAVFAGPGARAEGIEMLKKAVADLPKDADILLYCGCCPMEKCPNLRPAFKTLREMGYTKIRVLDIPTNMSTDWYSKGYPTDKAVAPK